MDHISIQTPGGPLSFVGRIHTDQARPSLVAVRGSFPPPGQLLDLPVRFAGVNVLVVTLPGMAGSFWADRPSVEGLTRGLEDAVSRLLPQAPLVVFGTSTGNLLSLGLRLPNIRRRVAVEPFFRTAHLWPLIANSRERLKMNPGFEVMARFFWEVFGFAPDRIEDRDYAHLLGNITQPTDVVVGGMPLHPVRKVDTWPSFTSAEDRARLAANPWVTMHEGGPDAGHAYGSAGEPYETVKGLIHRALLDVMRTEG